MDQQAGYNYCFIKKQKTTKKNWKILLIHFSRKTKEDLTVSFSGACCYPMAAKPIKTLEMHYIMIQI